MEDFRNKIAIVTGGASGIGQALVEELGKQGAKVIVADIRLETTTRDGKVQTVQVDVSRAEQVQSLVDRVVSDYGHLDYIFNNAGISIWGEVRDMTVAHWNQIMDTNFKGAMHGVMAAYPVMLKQGFGHIVNTASLAGLRG
jgi:NAD(P)-dependent dehydrogenase (short-subunit alcohol dehydrogenase family)